MQTKRAKKANASEFLVEFTIEQSQNISRTVWIQVTLF